MHTSVAVFLSFVVIYFGAAVLPFEMSESTVGWLSQAVSITGAVATFITMQSYKAGMGHAAIVLAVATFIAVLAALAVISCRQNPNCQATLPVHSLVVSSGFVTGSAAYIGFLVGSLVGLPLWATLVASIAFAPLYIGTIMPFVADGVTRLLDRAG